jgi:polyhydroxybutyrate depolymerase
MRFMITLVLSLLPAAAASGQNIIYLHDGIDRQYRIHIPDGVPESAPLVLALHGYGGTNNGMMNNYGWVQLADERGFVVAFPNGTRDQWNSRFWDVGYDFHAGLDIDDDGFLTALALHLQELHGLDENKTFVTGFSNGADMCFQLACREPETFMAFAPIIGTMMDTLYTTCVPAINRSILAMNATDDTTTLYEGDMDNSDGWGAYRSIPDVMAFWATVLGVPDMEQTYLPDTNPNDGSTVQLDVYRSPDHNLELRHYLVLGGGHDWPGQSGNMDIDATLEAWNFFDSLSGGCVGSDINTDGLINVTDVLLLIGDWGTPYDVTDLLSLLEQWGLACSGACCLSNGNCVYIDAPACEASGGSWNGSSSSCTVVNCP